MTFTITKAKLGIAILAMALLVPATAWATHSFDDVADGAFYHDASAWAKANGITVGSGNCGGTGNNFCGELGVTRGENITFAKRYDDFVVQPALTTLTGTAAANSAAIVANDVDIAAMPTVYTAQVESDCGVRNQSGGLTVTARGGFDYICDIDFPASIDACTAHVTPALFGANIGWALVGLAYAADPPVVWTQITDTDTIAVHQYLASGTATTASSLWFNMSVICA